MAAVILSMDVHCHGCAKNIRKAVMKLPGVDSVTFGTGLVVIEGTADAAALRTRLQAKTGKPVNVVSDGVEDGEAASGGGRVSGYASPPPPAPERAPATIILEMELHCRSCAKKVEKRVMQIPGVDTVTTDVAASRVEVTGTADASTVATSLQVRTRASVRVVSDSRRTDFLGYDHEQRKAVAAWAAAAQQMYGQPGEAATDPRGASSSVRRPAPPACCRRRRRGRTSAPALPPPVQPAGSSNRHSPSPPLQPYGAHPPRAAGAGYYYPPLGVYGGQYWAAAPSQPPVGFYTGQTPAPESYCPWQGGEVYGGQQMWAPFQPDENPHICRVQ